MLSPRWDPHGDQWRKSYFLLQALLSFDYLVGSSPRFHVPVTFPPGLPILCASPAVTGFSGVTVTIGIVRVALCAAEAPRFAPAKITSGLSATSSRASEGMRSATPSP